MEIRGFIDSISATRQVSESFCVREFVIKVPNARDPQYDDFVSLQLTGMNCASLDTFALGEDVIVKFDLRGRKVIKDGVARVFNTLNAWRIDRSAMVTQGQQLHQQAPPPYAGQPYGQPSYGSAQQTYQQMQAQNPYVGQMASQYGMQPVQPNDAPF